MRCAKTTQPIETVFVWAARASRQPVWYRCTEAPFFPRGICDSPPWHPQASLTPYWNGKGKSRISQILDVSFSLPFEFFAPLCAKHQSVQIIPRWALVVLDDPAKHS